MAFELVGLLLIWNLDFWRDMTQTLTLVLTSSLIALVIGVPLGIWMSKSNVADAFFKPVLDFMQTMPAFVYLIPAVAFFWNRYGARGRGIRYFRDAPYCSDDKLRNSPSFY